MTLLGLLSRRATIYRYGGGADDAHGNPTRTLQETATAVPCALEQIEPRELLIGRESYLATYRAAFLAGVGLDGGDELEVDGARYEVIGEPSRGHTPRGEHHVEALLREIG
jgi:hypothetical protein